MINEDLRLGTNETSEAKAIGTTNEIDIYKISAFQLN